MAKTGQLACDKNKLWCANARQNSSSSFVSQQKGECQSDPAVSLPHDVKVLCEELSTEIESYEHKVLSMLHKNEKDFLCAYSDHMRKVYKNLELMRRKIAENESALRRDELIQ